MSDKGQCIKEVTGIEEEVVVLKAVTDLIDSIVNYRFFGPINVDAKQVMFLTDVHAEYFNVILVDLLSKADEDGHVKDKTYLSCLASIAKKPHFNDCDTVGELAERTREFRDWLNTSFDIKDAWLPSIDKEAPLKMKRIDLIKIGGNICRHNFLRAARIARNVKRVFAESGTKITLEEALLILPDLNEIWLHENIFLYHSSTIAEHLNNIRWGIHYYLKPEFERSKARRKLMGKTPASPHGYPDGVDNNFAQSCYWDLMEKIRKEPIMRPFTVTESLKMRY